MLQKSFKDKGLGEEEALKPMKYKARRLAVGGTIFIN